MLNEIRPQSYNFNTSYISKEKVEFFRRQLAVYQLLFLPILTSLFCRMTILCQSGQVINLSTLVAGYFQLNSRPLSIPQPSSDCLFVLSVLDQWTIRHFEFSLNFCNHTPINGRKSTNQLMDDRQYTDYVKKVNVVDRRQGRRRTATVMKCKIGVMPMRLTENSRGC